jgi:hypothetical protein
MILPTKHISTKDTLLGAGAILIQELRRPMTVTALWEKVQERTEIGTFDRYLLGLDFLYAVGAVNLESGLLRRISL